MEIDLLKSRIVELENEVSRLKKENSDLKIKADYFDEQLKHSKNLLYRFDVTKQQYDYLSDYAEVVTGISINEFAQKSEADAFNETHPDDLEGLKKEIEALYKQNSQTPYKSLKYRRKVNDGYIWVRDDINALKNKKGEISTFLGTATNITKEKEVEDKLYEEKLLSQEIIDSSPNIIYVKDTNGKFTLINKAMADLFEENRDALLKRLNSDYDSFEYECDFLDKYENDVITSGDSVVLNERFTSPSGKKYWLHTIKALLTLNNKKYLLVNSTDLTQLRESEIKLRNNELIFKGIINATKDLIFLIDKDLRVITANQSAALLSGYDIDHMIGKDAIELFGEELGNPRKELSLKVLETKQMQRKEEHFNGIYVEMAMYPILDECDEVSQIVIMVKDITPLKKAALETGKALEKEIELSELKSSVLSTVSHEFRTPLAIILSNVQQIKKYREKLKPNELNKRTYLIENSIKHMNYMLNNISVLDKSDRDLLYFSPGEVKIKLLTNQLVQEVNSLFNESDRIEVEFSNVLDFIIVDESLIRHILLNLLSNALKYSNGNKTVELSVSTIQNNLFFKIKDYGIGINDNDLKNIWEPFYRGSNVSNIKGTGLGATIVKKCVELHEGIIKIDSKQNSGTVIELFLPYNTNVQQINRN